MLDRYLGLGKAQGITINSPIELPRDLRIQFPEWNTTASIPVHLERISHDELGCYFNRDVLGPAGSGVLHISKRYTLELNVSYVRRLSSLALASETAAKRATAHASSNLAAGTRKSNQ